MGILLEVDNEKYKSFLDLSGIDIDGNHTIALGGGEQVAYQGRKKRKTINSLYLSDRQSLPLALSNLIAGNHNDSAIEKIKMKDRDFFLT